MKLFHWLKSRTIVCLYSVPLNQSFFSEDIRFHGWISSNTLLRLKDIRFSRACCFLLISYSMLTSCSVVSSRSPSSISVNWLNGLSRIVPIALTWSGVRESGKCRLHDGHQAENWLWFQFIPFTSLTRFDNLPRVRFYKKLPAIKICQCKLEAAESLSERQSMFHKKIISLSFKF